MFSTEVLQTIAKYRVIPVVAIESADAALPLADALIEGGLPIVEITFRTKAAEDAIRLIVSQRPQLLVGAGTVLTVENIEAAKSAGAAFGVAPGLNPRIVERAHQLELPFIPGVATPSEIENGFALGCSLLKFFPSESLGGVDMLKALAAPYAHTSVRFVPTGGIGPTNLESYLSLPIVAAVGGTWLAKKEDIAKADWDTVRSRCRDAVATVAKQK